jgi:hypothetical protein
MLAIILSHQTYPYEGVSLVWLESRYLTDHAMPAKSSANAYRMMFAPNDLRYDIHSLPICFGLDDLR